MFIVNSIKNVAILPLRKTEGLMIQKKIETNMSLFTVYELSDAVTFKYSYICYFKIITARKKTRIITSK